MVEQNTLSIIDDPQGSAVLGVLRQGNRQVSSWGAVYFLGTDTDIEDEALCAFLLPILSDVPSHTYRFGNGDIVITWKGMQRVTLDKLSRGLTTQFAGGDDTCYRYYDMQAQGDAMREFCQVRLGLKEQQASATKPKAPIAPPPPQVTDPMRDAFAQARSERPRRPTPHTLVLTDQYYTGKLIVSLIGLQHKTYLTASAADAYALYARHAPDILLLDYELASSDITGVLAGLRGLDPSLYLALVVMEPEKPGERYGAQAIVTKPFTTSKLQAIIEGFRR